MKMILPVQTHSLNVGVVRNESDSFPDTDALVTQLAGVRIGVRTADCVPIVMRAADAGAVAVVHAGWKGSLGGIVDRTLDVLVGMGADPAAVKVEFGVSICSRCYEVDRDLADRFSQAGFAECVSFPSGADAKPHLDLQEVNVVRLLRRGVSEENIVRNSECTRHSTDCCGAYRYFSWRRSPGIADRNITSASLDD